MKKKCQINKICFVFWKLVLKTVFCYCIACCLMDSLCSEVVWSEENALEYLE